MASQQLRRMATSAAPATKEMGRIMRWYASITDAPESLVLIGLVTGVVSFGFYSIKRVYLNNHAGSYTNPTIRADPEKQVETASVGMENPEKQKHSLAWRIAQYKIDDKGPNVGIFDNRTRPHQYSKPGFSGTATGHQAVA